MNATRRENEGKLNHVNLTSITNILTCLGLAPCIMSVAQEESRVLIMKKWLMTVPSGPSVDVVGPVTRIIRLTCATSVQPMFLTGECIACGGRRELTISISELPEPVATGDTGCPPPGKEPRNIRPRDDAVVPSRGVFTRVSDGGALQAIEKTNWRACVMHAFLSVLCRVAQQEPGLARTVQIAIECALITAMRETSEVTRGPVGMQSSPTGEVLQKQHRVDSWPVSGLQAVSLRWMSEIVTVS